MKMSPEARAKVLFAALIVLLAAGGALWIVLGGWSDERYEIRSHDNVSGLLRGSPVEFHGVEVGRVDAIELIGPREVRVVLQVKRGTPVTPTTVATVTGRGLAARGFTGYVYVSLEETGAGGPPLKPEPGSRYARIPTRPGQAVSLDTTFSELNDNVQQAVTLLRTVLDAQTVASLKETLRSLDQVTQTLAAHNARLATILVNADRVTAQMSPLLKSSSELVKTLDDQLLPETRTTLAQLNALSSTSREAVRSLQVQLLPEAQRTVTRLDQLSSSLNETAERLRRDPSVLLRGARVQPGPGEAP